MTKTHDETPAAETKAALSEGARSDLPRRDLNSLLAQEQTSIMSAESAADQDTYQYHRDASLHARKLVNATSYPEHRPHVFSQDRAHKAATYGEIGSSNLQDVECNEQLLAREFADGNVSLKSLQHRGRYLRQDRARL